MLICLIWTVNHWNTTFFHSNHWMRDCVELRKPAWRSPNLCVYSTKYFSRWSHFWLNWVFKCTSSLIGYLCSSCVWFITQSEGGVLNNNCSSVLQEETAEGLGFSGIWTSARKAAVWKDLSCQPLYITSLHSGQHLNQFVCVSECVWELYSASMELECQLLLLHHHATSSIWMLLSACVCVCVRNLLFLPAVCWDPLTSLPSNEAPADDSHVKWRQMVDGSWSLTPVIRYGRSNWLAVFSINRHYGPLCQPAPLAALLFLEAPGSCRAPVLALTTLQVYSASLSAASFHIGTHSANRIKPRVPHWHFIPFYPHEYICPENNDLFTLPHLSSDQFSARSTILFTDVHMHSSYSMSLDAMYYFYCDARMLRHLGMCWKTDQQQYVQSQQ